jgi:hypothetical protein
VEPTQRPDWSTAKRASLTQRSRSFGNCFPAYHGVDGTFASKNGLWAVSFTYLPQMSARSEWCSISERVRSRPRLHLRWRLVGAAPEFRVEHDTCECHRCPVVALLVIDGARAGNQRADIVGCLSR